MAELGLDKKQLGLAFMAFTWAYALFEIPGGWMGDRWGARKVLMRIVIWWSIFTALTGQVYSLWALVLCRALFGAGEAGAFPNITKTFATWLPVIDRVRAQGILWLCARWGGALTPLLVVWLLTDMKLSWRHAFVIFGFLGVIWAAAFYIWYRDNPRDNPSVNEAELALIPPASSQIIHGKTPWTLFLRKPAVWLIWAQYMCLGSGWYYVNFIPTYLNELGVPAHKGAILAGLPFFFDGLGSFFCGMIFARLLSMLGGRLTLTRRIMAGVGFLGAAACLFTASFIKDPVWMVLFMSFACFCNDLVMPTCWTTCMDVGGRFCGTLSGSMNMFGNFAQGLMAFIIGYILSQTQNNWQLVFWSSAAFYLLGFVCWLFIDPVTAIDADHENSEQPV
jgi:MFS family permease